MFDIYVNDVLLYSTGYQDEKLLIASPVLSVEAGKAGSLEFTLMPTHYLYDTMEPLKTKVYVLMDGEEIFRGRVLNPEDDFFNQRKVTCEGDLAYLNDSIQPPRVVDTTISSLFSSIVSEHNAQVEAVKQFTVGQITVTGASETKLFSNKSYTDTKSYLNSMLIDEYGGFLRTRHVDGITYLDYIQEFTEESTQEIKFGLNMIDMSKACSADDIYTELLPTGNTVNDIPITIESVNGGSKIIENLDGVAEYGRIVRTENFSTDSPSELKTFAEDYIDKTYTVPFDTFTITAVDLHVIDADLSAFKCGNVTKVISTPHNVNTTRNVISITYDLMDIENTELTIGRLKNTPGVKLVGKPITDTIARNNGGSGGGAVGRARSAAEQNDELYTIVADKIVLLGEEIILKATKDELASEIVLLNESINLRVTSEDYNSEIELLHNNIALKVEQTVFDDNITSLQSSINLNASNIELKVSQMAYDTKVYSLESAINVNAGNINLKVAKNNIISQINLSSESIDISADKINITGENGIIVAGDLTVDGDLAIVSAELSNLKSGIVTAGYLRANTLRSNGTLYAASISMSETSGNISASGYNLYCNDISCDDVSCDGITASGTVTGQYLTCNTANIKVYGNNYTRKTYHVVTNVGITESAAYAKDSNYSNKLFLTGVTINQTKAYITCLGAT